jgi:hypothetical protein
MASKAVKFLFFGCALLVIACVLVIGGGGYYVRSKILKYAGNNGEYAKKTDELNHEFPFQPPAKGVITEDQILRFIAVRKQVHSVYMRYEPQFKNLQSKNTDLSVLTKGWTFIKEARQEHAKALENERMSPEEYQYIVDQVYRTWMASGTKDALKGKSFNDIAKTGLKESIKKIDQQLADPATPEAAKKALRKTREELQSQLQKVDQNSIVKNLDSTLQSIPPENLKLFQKYEKQLKEYSMGGLELVL